MLDKILDQMFDWSIPILILVLGIILGWLIKRFVHSRLSKLADKTKWRGDDIILNSIEPHIILWSFLATLKIAIESIKLSEPFSSYKEHFSTIIVMILILSVTVTISKMLVGLCLLYTSPSPRDA